ncbi:MAG: DMT family transporter [Alphaproteobacteria bacterium]|nr:DMT family transporter [Alphaproteobacteria bacterium]
MLAMVFGLFAALCWSLHDLVARRYASEIGPNRMAVATFLAGGILLLGVVGWHGTILSADWPTLGIAGVLGVIYGFAIAALFKAYSLAPLSIVGPASSGYPALVVFWGIIGGLTPSPTQYLAIGSILIGMVVVGRFGPNDRDLPTIDRGKISQLIFYCVVAEVCFAASVVLGQKIAPRIGEFEVTFLSRFPAALVIMPFVLRETPLAPRISAKAWIGIVFMAALDVAAVSGINYMGVLPNKELGAMGISAYGAIATLLAMLILKEHTTIWQWFGIAMISAGVAVLGTG